MLKKVLLLMLGLCLVVAIAAPVRAGDDKDKTGFSDDNKYTDYRYGFEIRVPDDWKIGKPKKEPNCQRIVAEKKNARIPPQLQDDPSWATRPTLMIFADSTKLTPNEFFAFLQSDTTDSELKKQIIKSTVLMDLYARHKFDVLLQTPTTLGGITGLQLKLRRQYEAQGTQLGDDRPMTIKDFVSGYVYLLQGDGWLCYIELACENQFLPVLEETFAEIIGSFTCPKAEQPAGTKAEEEPSEG
ncbi:MAG: hypothetical protein ABIJ61_05295 [bacterium]